MILKYELCPKCDCELDVLKYELCPKCDCELDVLPEVAWGRWRRDYEGHYAATTSVGRVALRIACPVCNYQWLQTDEEQD